MNKRQDELTEAMAALAPFAQDDLCRALSGNVEGRQSVVFQRGDAVLRLDDFLVAREIRSRWLSGAAPNPRVSALVQALGLLRRVRNKESPPFFEVNAVIGMIETALESESSEGISK